MDKDQAQFILQSFRPDGSDAVDADFASALRLAAEDRELGEWLASERAEDAAFAAALSDLEIPVELREQIMEVMDSDYAHDLEEGDALDKLFIDAVGQLQPPRELRDQVLTAMHIEQGHGEYEPTNRSNRVWPRERNDRGRKLSRVVAVAAALVVGAFFAYEITSKPSSKDGLFESYEVQHHAGNLINASFDYDVIDEDPERIRSWLVNHQLPTPKSIPSGLQKLSCSGCKEIKLPGAKRASMVCFADVTGGSIYLIIVSNTDILDRGLPALSEVTIKDCYHCKVTKCNVARWRDDQNTYILFKKPESEHKGELMNYF